MTEKNKTASRQQFIIALIMLNKYKMNGDQCACGKRS